MRVFVTGAAGAIGGRLVPKLVARGHDVVATTRSPEKLELLRGLGADAVVLDGLDGAAVGEAVGLAAPDVIVHQMTALAGKPNLRHFDKWFVQTNRLRTTGTEHLLAAGEAAGVGKLVAQSYTGWTNIREGSRVKSEDDPLDPNPARWQTESMAAIKYVAATVPSAPLEGIVLRYGNFYGPGASEALVELVRRRQFPIIGDGGGVWSWIHIDDAAAATVAAVERGTRGVYNVVDDDPAEVALWLPYLADVVGAKHPLRVPGWLGKLAAGEVPVQWMTTGRGDSNENVKRALDWRPAWTSWRDGFRNALTEPADQQRSGSVSRGSG
jgi:nucleoside-diphosphate-sugar epimerase